MITVAKVSKNGVFSGQYFPVFSPNTGNTAQKNNPCLYTLHAVNAIFNIIVTKLFPILKNIFFPNLILTSYLKIKEKQMMAQFTEKKLC